MGLVLKRSENHCFIYPSPLPGYQCEYKKRTGGKPDGCAVIFKSSRLSLLSAHPAEYLRPGIPLLDRDNVGLVVLLQPKPPDGAADQTRDPSEFICVANTHLLFNPRRGDIKLAQLAILLAEVSRLSRRPDGSTNPVVMCGDFNSVPWSPLYNLLVMGHLDYQGIPTSWVRNKCMHTHSLTLTFIYAQCMYTVSYSVHIEEFSQGASTNVLRMLSNYLCSCP